MKFTNILFAVFSLVLVAVVVSAAASLSVSKQQEMTLKQNGTFIVKNTGDVKLNSIALTSTGDFTVGFAPSADVGSLNAGQNSSVFTVYRTQDSGKLKFGQNSITVTAKAADNTTATTDFSFTKTFCKAGEAGGNLSLTKVKINSDGDKDDEWKLLNTITVEVKVRNDGDSSVKGVNIELGLFDDAGNNKINDVDFVSSDDETVDVGSIGDGDDETTTFEFQIPADMETENYKLAVKAYSDDAGEEVECADTNSNLDDNYFQSVSVESESKKSRFIAIDEIDMPTQAICGATISGSFELFNIGDDDQERVLVAVSNDALSINKEVELKSNLDIGESDKLDFSITVPSTAKDGVYTIEFLPSYDYHNGVYREESEDTFTSTLTVLGCNLQNLGNSNTLSINADLGSNAKAGEQLLVTSTIKNTGSEAVTVSLEAFGFESWASLDSISKRTLTLQPGQSESVTLTFDVKDGVTGSKNFVIEATSNGVTESQDVQVKFPEATSGFNLPSLSSGSGLIWAIVLVNVILVILIIFAVVKIARR